MTILADDDVIVNGDAERLCRFDDHFGHVDIGTGGCRIARGVVVHHVQSLSVTMDHHGARWSISGL